LTTKSIRVLVILKPGNNLRQPGIDNQRALCIVRVGKACTDRVQLGLNLLDGRVVLKVIFCDLNNELTGNADGLLGLALQWGSFGLGGRRAKGKLRAQGLRILVVKEPLYDLRKIGVDDQRALAIVGRGKIGAEIIELLFYFLLRGILLQERVGHLYDELTYYADGLLDITLLDLACRAERKLSADGCRLFIVLNIRDDLRKVSVNDEDALAIVGGRKIGTESVQFRLDLLVGGVIENEILGDLNHNLTDSARTLLNSALGVSNLHCILFKRRGKCNTM